MPSPTDVEKAKMQRLIDLTALLATLNAKIAYGIQPSPDDYDRLGDSQREYAELLSEFELRPPHK